MNMDEALQCAADAAKAAGVPMLGVRVQEGILTGEFRIELTVRARDAQAAVERLRDGHEVDPWWEPVTDGSRTCWEVPSVSGCETWVEAYGSWWVIWGDERLGPFASKDQAEVLRKVMRGTAMIEFGGTP